MADCAAVSRRVAVISALVCGLASAQTALHITSPTNGTIVHPGQDVTVTVEASGEALKGVYVIGTDPIGGDQLLTAPPYRFTVQIPRKVNSGIYVLRANGYTSPPSDVKRDWISIDVERADSPIYLRLGAELPLLPDQRYMLAVGATGYVKVSGLFADGTTPDLTESTLTKFTSDTVKVVTVQPKGILTGVAPGSAKITAINGKAQAAISVIVLDKEKWRELMNRVLGPRE